MEGDKPRERKGHTTPTRARGTDGRDTVVGDPPGKAAPLVARWPQGTNRTSLHLHILIFRYEGVIASVAADSNQSQHKFYFLFWEKENVRWCAPGGLPKSFRVFLAHSVAISRR